MTRQTKRRSMLWALFLTILAGRLNAQENAVNRKHSINSPFHSKNVILLL